MRSARATARLCFTAGVAASVLALSAMPASADRAYGGYEPRGEELVTFTLSEGAVPRVRAMTVRMRLGCALEYAYEFAATFSVVRRLPHPVPRNRNLLVLEPSKRGTAHARIRAIWGTKRSHLTWIGTLSVARADERGASLRIRLRSVASDDRDDRCYGELRLRARREPGVLYVGATDDDEPVWFRREGDVVEWLSGFGTPCRPSGFFEGIHADAILTSSPTAFGWPGLVDGFSHGEFNWLYAVSAHVQGQVEGDRARGTLRLVGSGGTAQADRCDTGVRHWTAVST